MKLNNEKTQNLAEAYPELAAQWHPTKNGNVMPETVVCGSHKKVWWYMPYDDSETGEHFEFEWQAVIQDRVNGAGCPFLTGNMIGAGFNEPVMKKSDVATK